MDVTYILKTFWISKSNQKRWNLKSINYAEFDDASVQFFDYIEWYGNYKVVGNAREKAGSWSKFIDIQISDKKIKLYLGGFL